MITAPASCELCGCWLPSHSSACPRNGVHPSQWKFDISNEEQEEVSLLDEFEHHQECIRTAKDKEFDFSFD